MLIEIEPEESILLCPTHWMSIPLPLVTSKQETMKTEFEEELTELINKHSQENASNTPDFILAQYLNGCLLAFNTATQQRETWYGRNAAPTSAEGQEHP